MKNTIEQGTKALALIALIDWKQLREQKQVLLGISTEVANAEKILGVVNLLDSIQDFAVDVLGVNENVVFEPEEEPESPEEKFAHDSAETIFDIMVEGEGLYDINSYENNMTVEFVNATVDNADHTSKIKSKIYLEILECIKEYPIFFNKDENGNLTYTTSITNDFGHIVEEYCQDLWDSKLTKKLWICDCCGSDNVQERRWVNINTEKVFGSCDDEDYYCDDCDSTCDIIEIEIPFKSKLIGFQVRAVEDNTFYPSILEDHVYNLSQANAIIGIDFRSWQLIAVFSHEIENPIFMFEGDPRS